MKITDKEVDPVAAFFAAVFLVGGVLAFVFASVVINAYVLSSLWAWYVVGFFHQPALPLAIAFGISLIVELVSPRVYVKDERSPGRKVASIFLYPAATLLIGWIGTFFI